MDDHRTSAPVKEEPRRSALSPESLDLAIIAAFSLVGGFAVAGSAATFGDGDTSWHIAAGEWMIAHRSIQLVDPFSFPMLGQRWIAHEWLSELVMGALYRIGGFAAVGMLTVASVVATLAIIGLWIRRWANSAELAISLALILFSLVTFVLARPMVLAWPVLALWMVVLLRARESGDMPPPWWTVLVMLVWVNLHASWILGMLIAAAFGLEAMIASPTRRVVTGWIAYGIALSAVTLLNPNFIAAWVVPLQAFTDQNIIVVQEFSPTDVGYTPMFELSLFAALAVGWWRGARIAPMRIIIVLAMLHLALAHMRHQALFLIVGGFLLVPPLTKRWIAKLPPRPGLASSMKLGPHGAVVLGLGGVLAFLAVAAARMSTPFEPLESPVNPLHGFAAIPPSLRSQPVLNNYSLGGPLILRGIRPFIDGRYDLYGSEFAKDYVRISEGDETAFRNAERRWNFGWTMLSPRQTALLKILDNRRDWRRHYADRFTVIHVKVQPPPAKK